MKYPTNGIVKCHARATYSATKLNVSVTAVPLQMVFLLDLLNLLQASITQGLNQAFEWTQFLHSSQSRTHSLLYQLNRLINTQSSWRIP